MSLLNAFIGTWSQARDTFGQSVPTGGSQFDNSAELRAMQTNVQAAAPDSRWQGTAAAAYAARNDEHAQIFEKLADLDSRLAAEIDLSAQVVSAGRAELDTVRDWVVSAASSVPNNQAGELMLVPIVSKGMGQLSDVVQRSNGELNTIGANIQKIGAEYASLTQGPRGVMGSMPQNPPNVDDLPWDEGTWLLEWEGLAQEARANNAALAAHLARRPPPGSPAEVVGPWNAQLEIINANAYRIYREQIAKATEGAANGLEVEPPPPPPSVNSPDEIPGGPYGAVPAGLVTPTAASTPATAKAMPI